MCSPSILLGHEINNLLLDVTILGIAARIVPRLQRPRQTKVNVLGIFLLGALSVIQWLGICYLPLLYVYTANIACTCKVCVCSIARLRAIWNPPNTVPDCELFLYIVTSRLLDGGKTEANTKG